MATAAWIESAARTPRPAVRDATAIDAEHLLALPATNPAAEQAERARAAAYVYRHAPDPELLLTALGLTDQPAAPRPTRRT